MVKRISLFILSVLTVAMFSIAPVTQSVSGVVDDLPKAEAIECIAKNIYYEARSESYAGQLSVGMVVLNRVNDSRFPDTVCGVVYQGKMSNHATPTKYRKGVCQFSWVCDGVADKPKNKAIWEQSLKTAKVVYRMYKQGFDITNGATHYHAVYVNPKWSTSGEMRRTGKVDSHVFYKWEIKS